MQLVIMLILRELMMIWATNKVYLFLERLSKFVKPYEKLMIDKIHEYNSNIKICRHSCGSTYDIIPDLIENGVNILNRYNLSKTWNHGV